MFKVGTEVIEGIDFSELEESVASSVDAFVGQVAQGALDEWTRLGQTTMRSGRAEYLKGLQDKDTFQKTGQREYEVALVGFLPNAMESGMSPKDLKPGLLSGKSSKTGKGGFRYATVPFRHYTSAKSAERTPKPSFAKELKDIVRKTGLNKVARHASGKAVSGRVKTITGTKGVVAKLKPFHATTPLEGLTRYQKTYDSGRTQGQLMTFRRVSESPAAKASANKRGISWANTWMHPGLKGVRILPKVADWAEKELADGIAMILGGK